jgi:hypothetical protein
MLVQLENWKEVPEAAQRGGQGEEAGRVQGSQGSGTRSCTVEDFIICLVGLFFFAFFNSILLYLVF